MDKLFDPIRDLIGALYDVMHDAAHKVWALVKPIFMIGFVFDLVSGQLGWISQILSYYREFIASTSSASWFLLVLAALFVAYFFKR